MKKELLIAELESRGIDYMEKELYKNGFKKNGLVINIEGCTADPVIYPEDIEKDDPAEVIDNVISEVESNKVDISNMYEVIKNFDKAMEYVHIFLRPVSEDKAIKTSFLDLEAVVELDFGDATVIVRKEMLQIWDAQESTVWKRARENTLNSVKEVFNMGEIIAVSNDHGCKGSGVLMFPEAFEEYAEDLDDDLWLVPSSIHEILLFKKSTIERSEVEAMIRNVNAKEVAPEEVIGDHPYVYNRLTKTITY